RGFLRLSSHIERCSFPHSNYTSDTSWVFYRYERCTFQSQALCFFVSCRYRGNRYILPIIYWDDPSSLRLLYTDKQLEDNDTFLDHQIKDRSTLFMVLRLPGGFQTC
uniref:Ubiquitin-like n=1 Tax=Sinocyclocheilus grahami TaxID=75366 RepID=A0A672QJR3_SINGR